MESTNFSLSREKTYYTIIKGKLILLGKLIHEDSESYEFEFDENKTIVPIKLKSHILEPTMVNLEIIDKESILNYNDVYCNGL